MFKTGSGYINENINAAIKMKLIIVAVRVLALYEIFTKGKFHGQSVPVSVSAEQSVAFSTKIDIVDIEVK